MSWRREVFLLLNKRTYFKEPSHSSVQLSLSCLKEQSRVCRSELIALLFQPMVLLKNQSQIFSRRRATLLLHHQKSCIYKVVSSHKNFRGCYCIMDCKIRIQLYVFHSQFNRSWKCSESEVTTTATAATPVVIKRILRVVAAAAAAERRSCAAWG